MTLAFLVTSAHGEAPPRKLISLTEVAPAVTPVSDYTGDIWNRSTMLGDPGGVRQDLYEKGFSLDVDMTQVVQGLVSGGVNENAWGYNGLLDYGAFLDTGKLGLWSGGLLSARAQTSWFENESFHSDVGNVSPVNFSAMWPAPFEASTVLMEYYLTQAFPKDIVLVVGRINPHNFLDTNRFGNDPKNQFMNISLGNDFVWGYFFSFSTYGAILAAPLPKGFSVAVAAWTPETQPEDYGGNWNSGGGVLQVASEWELFQDLAGMATVVGGYSSKDPAALDHPALPLGLITGNVPTKSGNWLVTLTFEQYLWKPKTGAGANPEARTKVFDYQEPGVGLFFRFGYTPQDRNPWYIAVSGGLGARGVVPGRPYDRMGFGVYGLIGSGDLEDQVIIGDLITDEVGIEAYYNFAITPWLQLSADLQWVAPGIASSKDAVVLGTRIFAQF
jgi:carbohydrate-selective porin OprB